MPSVRDIKAVDLKELVKLTFDNTTAADVTNEFLPVYNDLFGESWWSSSSGTQQPAHGHLATL